MSDEVRGGVSTVSGKVTLTETGDGIPDLLVAMYDVDPTTPIEELFRAPGDDHDGRSESLGSILTEKDGRFEFTIHEDTFRDADRRPDYQLVVLGPENAGDDDRTPILHTSPTVRRNAGRQESYLIRLSEAQLEEAGVPIPPPSVADPGDVVEEIGTATTATATIEAGLRDIREGKLGTVREHRTAFDDELGPQIRTALSSVPESLRASDTLVEPGDSVAETVGVVATRSVDAANETELDGHLGLTDSQLDALAAFEDDSGDFVDVPGETLEPLLAGDGDGQSQPIVLHRDDPIARVCRDETLGEQCLADAETNGAGEIDDTGDEDVDDDAPEGDGADDEVELIEMDDVPRYVAPLLETMTAPEEGVSFGVTVPENPADRQAVQENIDTFLLESGPADTPAFHDFHQLQLAFEPVWQEAIDNGILDLSADAYSEIVELGGDPCQGDPFEVLEGAVVDCFERETADLERTMDPVHPVVVKAFEITTEQWNALDENYQYDLVIISAQLNSSGLEAPERRRLRQQGERMISYADSLTDAGVGRFDRIHEILEELDERVREDYPFTVYGANSQERSVNYGVLATYRQWRTPVAYQVGELLNTTTLAPNEVRKFSKKTVEKTKRSEKEVEKSLQSREDESTETSRYETEILRRAERKTNFDVSTEGSFDIELASGTATTAFGTDAASESSEVKRGFREAVVKAAQEIKDERTVEVTSEESFEADVTESWEVENQNQELSLTALYYELQRRYRVSEQLHRLTPVVLVAQEVPNPADIDDDWLIAHDWILRRFALDDSIKPALEYLSNHVVGDEVALEELRSSVQQQRQVVNELKEELVVVREQADRHRMLVDQAILQQSNVLDTVLSDAEGGGGGGGGGFGIGNPFDAAIDVFETAAFPISAVGEQFGEYLFGGEDTPAVDSRLEAAKENADRSAQAVKDVLARLEREVTALTDLSEQYTTKLSDHLNHRTQISRLRTHVKQNILHYMQAIWSVEPHDQRYFRLHKVQVPSFEGSTSYTIGADVLTDRVIHPADTAIGTYGFTVSTDIDPEFETVDLASVADLDDLLGFKGNYMIFPLRETNALTDFMMQPYLDTAFGEFMSVHDPDEFGNFSLEAFSEYVCCLHDEHPEEFEELAPALREQFDRLLLSPHRNNEEIVVPTDSLYMELLPGSHTNLEQFKLLHRAIDVKQVQAEARAQELENVRSAARLLGATDDHELLDDPDVDTKIIMEGGDGDIVVPTDDE